LPQQSRLRARHLHADKIKLGVDFQGADMHRERRLSDDGSRRRFRMLGFDRIGECHAAETALEGLQFAYAAVVL
jgi:hypothetical protein